VRELWEWDAERLEEKDVLRRIGEVVFTTNHVGDPHICVIHDHGEVVERAPIGTQNHEVTTERLSVDFHAAAHEIINNNNARLDAEAECRRLTSRKSSCRLFG
jgi:hypothetical protein